MYIIKEREFINAQIPVFKVGYSDDLPDRMKSYPKGSIILATMRVNNGRSSESKLLAALRSRRFINRRDIGSESFEGPLMNIVNVFYETCLPMMSDYSVKSPAVMSTDVPVESPDDGPDESLGDSKRRTHVNLENKWENKWSP